MKELSPHINSVMNILESHASYLMSGKELSKLVAFVKGTQFDLVVRFSPFIIVTVLILKPLVIILHCNFMQEYLQRERQGSARLENFASALELIGEKVFV